MNYENLSKEELIYAIQGLTRLNKELLEEKEQDTKLEYAWTGNLGHWYWDIITNTVTFNPLKVTNLGFGKNEIPEKVNYQFFTEKLHPNDYEKTMDSMRAHLSGKASVYEVEYRIRAKDGSYKWYYDRGKITQYDDEGNPVFLAGIVFDITEKKEMQEQLEYRNKMLSEQASKDGLTQVANHRTIVEHLQTQMSGPSNKFALSISLIDLDDFKNINDTKGHICGDKVLIEVAQILQKFTRKNDLVGRYGGEEFLIVFGDTNGRIARSICDRIRKEVESHSFYDDTKVTISVGVIEYRGESLSELIDAADKNLYQAKKRGKNLVV